MFFSSFSFLFFFLFSPEDIFSLLLGREEGRDRNMDWFCPVHTHSRDQTSNPGVYPDWELNPQTFSYRMMLQPTEPHWPGLRLIIFKSRIDSDYLTLALVANISDIISKSFS